MPHTSMSQAGLNAMSIASIICTLMFILKPEFILNFFTPGRLRPVKRRPKSKRPVMVSGVGNSSHDDEEDAEIEQPGYNGIMDRSAVRVDIASHVLQAFYLQILLLGKALQISKFHIEKLNFTNLVFYK
ncbi:hypothetical protein MJO29_006122 [Puccinia striiformis f. sp. tritici]|nr:hypothetical protein MJO29_006122 [Puccinia striiformis f. sp. tritici]